MNLHLLLPLLAAGTVVLSTSLVQAQAPTNGATAVPPVVANGPTTDRSLLRPDSKTPINLETSERNPFGLVSVPKADDGETVTEEDETEEMKIRRVLANMRISGLSGTEGNYQVLLGPMALRKGDLLPQLFANQAEVLRVEEITDREITVAFVESDTSMVPRKFGVSYDVSPQVRSLMPGEAFRKLVSMSPQGKVELPPLETAGVTDFLQGVEEQKFESMVDRSFEMLGVGTRPQADENGAPQTR